jgi:excisionase family DNA binding protein|tara:strand:- start:192 stop:395 length:204 start_codon:yes stop_codon:yes gene_type:complete
MNDVAKGAMTVEQTAKFLGIGRSMAYEAARSGELPARRIGTRWIIPVGELERWMAASSHDVPQDVLG